CEDDIRRKLDSTNFLCLSLHPTSESGAQSKMFHISEFLKNDLVKTRNQHSHREYSFLFSNQGSS
ncbi:hypothetical protein NJC40_29130, partial [Pseudomonas sp. 21LCFQ02]|uniref:hypothetical protein n=1 Tax=Pseudomonas sp. 21LCFQ02 TaxID=2957505 RepID=UPI00209A7C2B